MRPLDPPVKLGGRYNSFRNPVTGKCNQRLFKRKTLTKIRKKLDINICNVEY